MQEPKAHPMLKFTNRNNAVVLGRGFILSLFFIFFFSISYAQVDDVGYLLVDKTKTPWGHKFFKVFSEIWNPPKGITGYFVIIEEKRPSNRQSWLYVEVGDNIFNTLVYVTILKPTTSDFDMQRYAVEASKNILKFLLSNFLQEKESEKF